MVKGLELFRERFREFEGAFTLIGGAACDEWFTAQGRSQFRERPGAAKKQCATAGPFSRSASRAICKPAPCPRSRRIRSRNSSTKKLG